MRSTAARSISGLVLTATLLGLAGCGGSPPPIDTPPPATAPIPGAGPATAATVSKPTKGGRPLAPSAGPSRAAR